MPRSWTEACQAYVEQAAGGAVHEVHSSPTAHSVHVGTVFLGVPDRCSTSHHVSSVLVPQFKRGLTLNSAASTVDASNVTSSDMQARNSSTAFAFLDMQPAELAKGALELPSDAGPYKLPMPARNATSRGSAATAFQCMNQERPCPVVNLERAAWYNNRLGPKCSLKSHMDCCKAISRADKAYSKAEAKINGNWYLKYCAAGPVDLEPLVALAVGWWRGRGKTESDASVAEPQQVSDDGHPENCG